MRQYLVAALLHSILLQNQLNSTIQEILFIQTLKMLKAEKLESMDM
jgi:hypothetical protein